MFDPRKDPNSFAISGIEPNDPAWLRAPRELRLRFWQRVGQLAFDAKQDELSKGLDRFGNRMVPISEATRKARRYWDYSPMGLSDPKAPPLMPNYSASRTRSLLRWKAFDDQTIFFWAFDPHTGRPWGEILDYHREGGGNLPIRDVIGLSPNSLATVRRRAMAWWRSGNRALPPDRNARETRHGVIHGGGIVGGSGKVIPDFNTGWRDMRGGNFVQSGPKRHLDRLAGVGVKP